MTPTPRHVGVPHPSALFAVRAASHDSADGARLNNAAPALLASPTCLAPPVEHVLSFRNPSAPRSHFRPPPIEGRGVATRGQPHAPVAAYIGQATRRRTVTCIKGISCYSRPPRATPCATRHATPLYATPPNYRPTGYLTESDPHVPPPLFSLQAALARRELHRLLEDEELASTPLLVLANKVDLEPHMTEDQVIRELNLDYVTANPWILIPISALKVGGAGGGGGVE